MNVVFASSYTQLSTCPDAVARLVLGVGELDDDEPALGGDEGSSEFFGDVDLFHAQYAAAVSDGVGRVRRRRESRNAAGVPEAYVFSEEQRPTTVSTKRSIPIIDLEEGSEDEVVKEILNAAKEYGVFKVINHGIPEELIDDVISVAQEFFEMPVEDKAPYYSEDPTKDTRLFTGQGFRKENIHFWRDCLIMSAYPVEKYEHQFPEKPDNLKRIMGKFVPEGRKLVRRLLELISKGLGLEEDYLTGDISEGSMKMVFNYYPPCPDPSLTLGLPKHCDITLINLLLQGNVSGLQVLHDDNWISVDPLPNSFVVNFGLLLEEKYFVKFSSG
ncbi:uncharacterized protein A4U43_C07F24230 [Asparagus officinalis]|uniref:Fe2OG dioxygenase domain-containing protein n=1 Tax=Asparagus officinalis TaxID=4686 RepID=A0A5P1EEH8_ASPOF|nr:uncharacterized protein A4U43_C07F24230 [Asparagus officinalis]